MTKWFVGLSLAAALAVAGCGGGGSRLSKQDFITQADQICTTAHTAENAIQFPSVDPATASAADMKKFGAAIAAATKVDRTEVDDLRKLKAPSDYQPTFDEAMKELSEGLDHADNAVDEADKSDATGLTRELNEVQAKANEANAKAKAYGLKVCGASS